MFSAAAPAAIGAADAASAASAVVAVVAPVTAAAASPQLLGEFANYKTKLYDLRSYVGAWVTYCN